MGDTLYCMLLNTSEQYNTSLHTLTLIKNLLPITVRSVAGCLTPETTEHS